MPQEEAPTLVKLVGGLFAAALVTALAAGALVAPRLGGAFAQSFFAASAAFALPALLTVTLVRLAAASLGGDELPQFRPVLVAFSLTSAALFVFSLALGRALRATTHHTGLAGTTFAIASAACALAVLPLGLRLASAMRAWRPEQQAFLVAASALGVLAMLGMALVRLHRALGLAGLGYGAAIPADLVTVLVLGVACSLAQVGRPKAGSLVAPPLFVALLFAGMSILRAHPELSSSLAERALFPARCSAWLIR